MEICDILIFYHSADPNFTSIYTSITPLQIPVEIFPRSLCGFIRLHPELVLIYGGLTLPRL